MSAMRFQAAVRSGVSACRGHGRVMASLAAVVASLACGGSGRGAETVIPADLGRQGHWQAYEWNKAKGRIAVDAAFPADATPGAGQTGKSLKVTVQFSAGKTFEFFQVALPKPRALEKDIAAATCWIKGSATPHYVEFYFTDAHGKNVKVSPRPGRLSFSGWKLVRAKIPAEWNGPLTFRGMGFHNWHVTDAAVATVHLAKFELHVGKRVRPVLPPLDKPIATPPRPLGPRRPRAKAPPRDAAALADAGEPFGKLTLIDEINCADPTDPHKLAEGPGKASRIETILGRPCRVLPNRGGAKYFAYRIGAGKGLVPGVAYVLAVEYPEDKARTTFILNRGCETMRGFRTGAALGDVIYTYTNNNVESLKVPLAGGYRTWKQFFFLHDRFPGISQPRGAGPRGDLPADGFRVIVAQSRAANAPMSAGAAVRRIRLFEVARPERLNVALRLPPAGLPRRHLFWREEMADGVIHSSTADQRGVKNDTDWFEYKARLMQFLGMNTFCKDLLEFGHNQGWDSAVFGGTNWVNQSKTPMRWRDALAMLKDYPFDVLPYYEYAGSIGRFGHGTSKRCRPLSDIGSYTHITWSEKANLDVTDPAALEDARKILYATIVRHAGDARFVGAWFRTRPSNIPVSFSDRALGRFAKESGLGGEGVTRAMLTKDAALLKRYLAWWFGKRKAFLLALRDYLRKGAAGEAVVLFTADGSESGVSLAGWDKKIVTDDVPAWRKLLTDKVHAKTVPTDHREVAAGRLYAKALLAPRATWGTWEWQHSLPQADPNAYTDVDGVMMTCSFNQACTVADAAAMRTFRTPGGLAMIRHYPLNENVMDKLLGYFVIDVERAGPYCMLAEAHAMARGDPRYLGYLASNRFNRGFPEYVRRFNAAFLALPALPSTLAGGACDDPDITVRTIPTKAHGTYFAIVNTALRSKPAVLIRLPAPGRVTDATTGRQISPAGKTLKLNFHPCQLRALHVE